MNSKGIIAEKVYKKYGDFNALKGVDLQVEIGEFLLILGPNGAGKTTLIKIMCGLTHPTKGKASVGDLDVNNPDVRKKVGVISHKSYLYDNLTAIENLIFYANLYGIESPAQRAFDLLTKVELGNRKDDLVSHFSRGMIQRLSIARALIADPDFIFLDEPFTGLDQHSANLFKNLLKDLHSSGKTFLMITHNIEMGLEMATRVIILKKGRKIYDEKTNGLEHEVLKNIYSQEVEK